MGVTMENVSTPIYGMQAFSLRYDEEEIRNYRRIADKNEIPETQPAELNHIHIRWYSTVLLYNERCLLELPQEAYLEYYECGKIMVQMIDYWLSQLSTPSNEHDSSLIQSQTGNIRMETYMRRLERDSYQMEACNLHSNSLLRLRS